MGPLEVLDGKSPRGLVEIISMVKHAANAEQPLYTAEERVQRAFAKVTAGREFNVDQQQWLDRIRATWRPTCRSIAATLMRYRSLTRRVAGAERTGCSVENLRTF